MWKTQKHLTEMMFALFHAEGVKGGPGHLLYTGIQLGHLGMLVNDAHWRHPCQGENTKEGKHKGVEHYGMEKRISKDRVSTFTQESKENKVLGNWDGALMWEAVGTIVTFGSSIWSFINQRWSLKVDPHPGKKWESLAGKTGGGDQQDEENIKL